MKKLLLFSMTLLCAVSAWAVQRTPEEAFDIARSFFAQRPGTRAAEEFRLVAVSGDLLQPVDTRSCSDEPSFYIYNHGQTAYVIVSGDDRMKPVLGYSEHGAFVTENLPSNLRGWLTLYDAAHAALAEGKPVRREPCLMTRAAFPESVNPLLGDINWNQDAPYNNDCPVVGGGRSVTGCVATAMAMVMRYHNYPVQGKGTHSYKCETDGKTYSFDFGGTTFDWGNMLPAYTSGNYTQKQAAAVAELMYACGVSVDMAYSPGGSGALGSAIGQALIDYFNYDSNLGMVEREYFTSEEWMNMIKKELSEQRPIIYGAASTEVGHEFVFDGYDAQDMVHVNWGWGGHNNGYFEVASLNPDSPGIGGGTGQGGGFVFNQSMAIGVCPPTDESHYTSHFSLDSLGVSKDKLNKNESFDAGFARLFNRSTLFTGQAGLIAEKDGKQSVLGSFTIEQLKTGWGYEKASIRNCRIPQELTDGTYALYFATKEQRETSWSRARSALGYETKFTLTVSGNNCTVAPFIDGLQFEKELVMSVEPLHNLYAGYKGDFRMKVSNLNSTDEYYGMVGVLLITPETEKEKADIIGMIGQTQLLLEPNAIDKEYLASGDLIANLESGKNVSPGDYYICPGATWGKYIYGVGDELTPVTIKSASPGPTVLAIQNARLENDQLQVGEKLKLTAELSLSGLGSVYSKTLLMAIFAEGESSSRNLHYADVFVEKGETQQFEMEVDPRVEAGKYLCCLYKPGLGGDYGSPVCGLSFTVTPSTGIQDETASVEGVRILQQPVEDQLRLRTAADVRMISIYNLSGQQVMRQSVSGNNAGGEYSIPVVGLTSGYYILMVQTADGKTYRSRFGKR